LKYKNETHTGEHHAIVDREWSKAVNKLFDTLPARLDV
jgi:hypothetical protein